MGAKRNSIRSPPLAERRSARRPDAGASSPRWSRSFFPRKAESMLGWNRIAAKTRNLFRGSQAEQELQREIDSHVALIEEDLVRQGMTPEDASREARRRYGSVTQIKELHREERS